MRSRDGVRVTVLAAVVLAAGTGLRGGEVGAAGVTSDAAPASCEEFEDPVELTSVEQVETLLVGTWIRCSGEPLPWAEGDGIGLDVTPDGRFHLVYELADGSLALATGPTQGGQWDVIDTTAINGPGHYQVNWHLSGGPTAIGHIQFFESPPTFRTGAEAPSTYQRWTGPAPDTTQPPVAIGDCPPTGGEKVTPASVEEALVGTWIRCSGDPFAGANVDEIGIEVTADGRFYRVFRLPDGTLARATGLGQEGTWDVAGQVNWHFQGTGTHITHPHFYDDLAMLQLVRFDPGPAYFTRWTGEPPVIGTPPPETNACGALADPIAMTSVEQTEELVVGVWLHCAGPAFPAGYVDAVGLEFASDERWYSLREVGDGSLSRADGVDHDGTWSVDDTDAPHYALWTEVLGRGFDAAHIMLLETPSAMRLSNTNGDSDFVRVEDPLADSVDGTDPPDDLAATGGSSAPELAVWASVIGLLGIGLVGLAPRRRALRPGAED